MPTLSEILRDPAYSGLSDVEAAAALSKAVKTPKTTRITVATLGSESAWGVARAEKFTNDLELAKAAGDSRAAYALRVLTTGLDPADPGAQERASNFVRAGLCSQEEVDRVFYDTSYPAGEPVAEHEVAEARAASVRTDQANDLIRKARDWERDRQTDTANRAAEFVTAVEAWRDSGEGDAPDIGGI